MVFFTLSSKLPVFARASDRQPALWFEREEFPGDRADSLRSLLEEKMSDRLSISPVI